MSKRKLPKSSCSYQITTRVQRAVRRCREHENEIENKKRTTEILNLWRTTGILMKFMVYNWNPNIICAVQLKSKPHRGPLRGQKSRNPVDRTIRVDTFLSLKMLWWKRPRVRYKILGWYNTEGNENSRAVLWLELHYWQRSEHFLELTKATKTDVRIPLHKIECLSESA